MDFFDTTTNFYESFTFLNDAGSFSSSSIVSCNEKYHIRTTIDKDWMPYKFFEYDPIWHKKYAAIKNQMATMWD